MADPAMVIRGLEALEEEAYSRWVHCQYTKDKLINGIGKYIPEAISLLKAQEPREITKQEWEEWKKAKNRDPLCYVWVGDGTPFWILKPEDINEVLYFAGSIKIYNAKPTERQRETVKRDAPM